MPAYASGGSGSSDLTSVRTMCQNRVHLLLKDCRQAIMDSLAKHVCRAWCVAVQASKPVDIVKGRWKEHADHRCLVYGICSEGF